MPSPGRMILEYTKEFDGTVFFKIANSEEETGTIKEGRNSKSYLDTLSSG